MGSENGSFVRGNAIEIAHYNGTIWDAYKLATLGGSGPYTATASGFTDFSPFVVTNQNALSVELTNIAVKATNKANIVSWSTASEKNNAYFDVQHATNGVDFTTIGKVKGKGTTNALSNYSFEDATPALGTNYYRLRQVDYDGTATLSKVVSVQFNGNGKSKGLKVYPTLASDKLNVVVESDKVETFNIIIYWVKLF